MRLSSIRNVAIDGKEGATGLAGEEATSEAFSCRIVRGKVVGANSSRTWSGTSQAGCEVGLPRTTSSLCVAAENRVGEESVLWCRVT